MKDRSTRTLINGGAFSKYSEEHIFFTRNGSLFAVPFDLGTGSVGKTETLIVKSIYSNTNGSSLYAVGGKNLVFVEGLEAKGTNQLVWVDRGGKYQTIFNNTLDLDFPRISPSGDKIALTLFYEPNGDLWLLEL